MQEETPGTEQPQDAAAVTTDNRSGRGFGKLCFTASEHPGYSADPASEQVQTQIRTLTQLQETAVIDAAQLQLLGQLQTLEQVQLNRLPRQMPAAGICGFNDSKRKNLRKDRKLYS